MVLYTDVHSRVASPRPPHRESRLQGLWPRQYTNTLHCNNVPTAGAKQLRVIVACRLILSRAPCMHAPDVPIICLQWLHVLYLSFTPTLTLIPRPARQPTHCSQHQVSTSGAPPRGGGRGGGGGEWCGELSVRPAPLKWRPLQFRSPSETYKYRARVEPPQPHSQYGRGVSRQTPLVCAIIMYGECWLTLYNL